MTFLVWHKTDVGLRRELNEDSILVNKDLGLFIVADGMGGHNGGEIASSLAVQTADQVIKKNKSTGRFDPRDSIRQAFVESSSTIFEHSLAEGERLRGMGTTMVLALIHENTIYFGNVGDSRAYYFKNPHLWQITEDHSLINEQVRAGLIPEDVPKNYLGRNVITRSVGYERNVRVDLAERDIQNNDIFMLCSDGLSGLVTDVEVSEIVSCTLIETLTDKLVDLAKERGGDDNISVIIVQIAD